MKEITYFYLASCPFCRAADMQINEILEEHPEYKDIKINKIEETRNPDIAEKYNYYYVPCMWIGDEKLHEGASTKEKLLEVFKKAAE